MAKSSQVPSAPNGTGPSGRALWRDVMSRYELEQHEEALLREMVRCVDQLDALHAITASEGLVVEGPHGQKAHPALTAAQQQRIVLARLAASLRLPAGEQDDSSALRRPQRRGAARGVYSIRDSV
ncbi:terminase [Mycobacterium marinum]|uniref:terminase n=1 Tax=Mycobacterium marinum TaxID=1781 RepID=UPI00356696B6